MNSAAAIRAARVRTGTGLPTAAIPLTVSGKIS